MFKIALKLFCFAVILFGTIFIPFYPVDSSNDGFGENKLLIQYEIIGVSHIKVLKGGEELIKKFKIESPNIVPTEIVFTKNSDEPKKHLNSAEFDAGGLASRYTYIIYGEPVGTIKGAPDCCSLDPINECVTEFKVDKWYPTTFAPEFYFATARQLWSYIIVAIALTVSTILCIIPLVGLIVEKLYWRFYKIKKN